MPKHADDILKPCRADHRGSCCCLVGRWSINAMCCQRIQSNALLWAWVPHLRVPRLPFVAQGQQPVSDKAMSCLPLTRTEWCDEVWPGATSWNACLLMWSGTSESWSSPWCSGQTCPCTLPRFQTSSAFSGAADSCRLARYGCNPLLCKTHASPIPSLKCYAVLIHEMSACFIIAQYLLWRMLLEV